MRQAIQKLKSYTGIAVAFLALGGLIPTDFYNYIKAPDPELTPFDNTAITRITVARFDDWRLHNEVIKFLRTCDNTSIDPQRLYAKPYERPKCAFLFENIRFEALLKIIHDPKNRLDPENQALGNRAIQYILDKPYKYENALQAETFRTEAIALAHPVGKIILQHVQDREKSLTIKIVLANFAGIALFLLLLFKRNAVGGVVLAVVLAPFKWSLRLIKAVHQKV